MAIHPAIVINCDGYQCDEKLALIGPNAVSYRGARGHALALGWSTTTKSTGVRPATPTSMGEPGNRSE